MYDEGVAHVSSLRSQSFLTIFYKKEKKKYNLIVIFCSGDGVRVRVNVTKPG